MISRCLIRKGQGGLFESMEDWFCENRGRRKPPLLEASIVVQARGHQKMLMLIGRVEAYLEEMFILFNDVEPVGSEGNQRESKALGLE